MEAPGPYSCQASLSAAQLWEAQSIWAGMSATALKGPGLAPCPLLDSAAILSPRAGCLVAQREERFIPVRPGIAPPAKPKGAEEPRQGTCR